MIPLTLPCPDDRAGAANFVQTHAPWAKGGAAEIKGGGAPVEALLTSIDPMAYGRTRNHLNGAVTRLSPYIRHGVISASTVRNHVLEKFGKGPSEKFLQQLAWRDYWQRIYHANPEMIWHDVEDYKTGFRADDYAGELPPDILAGQTGVAVIDQFIIELTETGYLHNHARLYLAAYICHWRRVKWQAGARWFLAHLLDGDPASNNLSFQWVASTFSHKPYFFNLENVQKYSDGALDTRPDVNAPLAYSYSELHNRLFPNLEARA